MIIIVLSTAILAKAAFTPREALHSAQVLQMALETKSARTLGSYPESGVIEERELAQKRSRRKTTWCLGAAAVAAVLWIAFVREEHAS
jgi:hypothetical protein